MKRPAMLKDQIFRYYLFVFLKDLSFFGAVLVPFFTVWGGLPQSQVQVIQSWFMFWFFVMEVPTGAIADYVGRKYSLALGALTVAIAAVVYGSVPDLRVFLLAEFLFAVAMSLISGADQAWLYDTLKEHHREKESTKIFGKSESLNLFAMFVSAVTGGFVASTFGLNAPMLLSSIPYFLAAFVALTLKEPQIHTGPSESKRYLQIVQEGVAYLFRHHELWQLASDAILVATSAYFVIWFYQPLLTSLGVPIFLFGVVQASLLLVEIAISHHFDKLESFFAQYGFAKVSAFLTSMGFFAAAIYPSYFTAAVFIGLAGGFGLTRFTYLSAKMNPLIPSDKRATVLSSISMIRRFALVLFNPVFGFLADYSLRGALFIVGVLPLFSLLLKKNSAQAENLE